MVFHKFWLFCCFLINLLDLLVHSVVVFLPNSMCHLQVTSTSLENMQCFNDVVGRLQESGNPSMQISSF